MNRRELWWMLGAAVGLYLLWLAVYTHSLDLHAKNFDYENFLFDADGTRVVKVATIRGFTSTSERHPLYVSMLQPAGIALDWILGDPIDAALGITAAFAALAIPFALVMFRRSAGGLVDGALWTVLFAGSGAFWLFAAMPETFAINVATIVIGFVLQLTPRDGPLSVKSFRRRFALHVAFGVAATGITLTNSVYAFFSACSLVWKHRPAVRAWRFIAARLVLYVVCVTVLLGLLSRLQGTFYPRAHEFTGASGYTSVLKGDEAYLITEHTLPWLGVEARTFLADTVVAPRAGMTEVLFTNRFRNLTKWHIVQYAASAGWMYWACVAFAAALIAALWLRARGAPAPDAPRWRPEIAMALAAIAFNLALHSVYRAIGAPVMYSTHVVFPILFLLSVLYGRSKLRGKRVLLGVLAAGVLATNAAFLGDVNDALRNANPRPFRVPPEGRVVGVRR